MTVEGDRAVSLITQIVTSAARVLWPAKVTLVVALTACYTRLVSSAIKHDREDAYIVRSCEV